MDHSSDRLLLREILRRVSRSFYLTLAVLPSNVRDQVGLAYIFARTADTIADAGSLDHCTRLGCLRQFKQCFIASKIDVENLVAIRQLVIDRFQRASERALLEELVHGFEIYERLLPADRQDIARLLPTLIDGMIFDLCQFPEVNGQTTVTALPSMAELDYYTYAVAGCVGEFWTRMMCRHRPRLSGWDRQAMAREGIRFGKGLQLINVLRDLPEDVRRGRCYIPASLLAEVGLSPQDLLDGKADSAFRPIFRRLILTARDHLDHGWLYTMMIPRAEIRLRLACMWPLLIGLRTLHKLWEAPTILAPAEPIKISRGEVYRIVAATTLTGGCGYVGTAYWGSLRKRLA
ncbi:MAG: squalene/phytoene synthase family protein [Nitrospirae bacterium]|nr:MAG: squalene/phytoene synthase family protein [Nitrospirota bacterium]